MSLMMRFIRARCCACDIYAGSPHLTSCIGRVRRPLLSGGIALEYCVRMVDGKVSFKVMKTFGKKKCNAPPPRVPSRRKRGQIGGIEKLKHAHTDGGMQFRVVAVLQNTA
jgi:hypothetical protein